MIPRVGGAALVSSLMHAGLCLLPLQVKTTRWLATGDSGQPEVLGALAGLMLTDGILGRENKFSDIFATSRVPASLKTGQASSCPRLWAQQGTVCPSAIANPQLHVGPHYQLPLLSR